MTPSATSRVKPIARSVLAGWGVLLAALCLSRCSNDRGDTIAASGTIESIEVSVGAKVGGQIVELRADEGRLVQQGDTLARIDRTDLDLQRLQAEANLAAADAQYRLAVRGARSEDVAQAKATYTHTRSSLERVEGLFREGGATEQQLDDARTRFVVAEQNFEKLRRGTRTEEIDAARARRDQAAAQVQIAQKRIADTYVTSPIGGAVTQQAIEEGEIAQPNATLFRIARLSDVTLTIYVSTRQLALVKLGQEAKVFIDAVPERAFPGTVTHVSPVAEFTPKNVQTKEDRTKLVFAVKIALPNPDGMLKPGMPADAVIDVAER